MSIIIYSQVDDIEMKIDQLTELYMEDRKRFLALPFWSEQLEQKAKAAARSVPMVVQTKKILVDKQSSEPSSPTNVNFKEQVIRRPMHRGFSDLGNRIKKKVTLRFVICCFLLHFS